MERYVAGFLMSYDMDRFLMINKRGFETPHNTKLLWQPPGGKIETVISITETPPEAMAREFLEETNHKVSIPRWHCFHIKEYRAITKIYFFVAFCSPNELHEAVRLAAILEESKVKDGQLIGARECSLIDVLFEPQEFTFDIPYLIQIILREQRSGFLLRLDPEGTNSAQKNK